MTHVAVLLPTRRRAAQMKERVSALLKQDVPAGVTLAIYLSIEETDKATLDAAKKLTPKGRVHIVGREPDTTAVEGWNAAYAAAMADGATWFVLGADDVIWHEGWLAEALRVAEETCAAVIGLNDGHTRLDHYGAHYMVRREFTVRELGGYMAPPMYQSWWFDREVCEKAIALGLYAAAPGAMAEHTHPDWGTAEMDDTYRAAWHLHDQDRLTYKLRKLDGFPLDYAAGEGD